MGRMQRRKGGDFERLIASIFREFFPEAKRGIGQARAASEVPDVDGVPLMWIECKHGQATKWRGAVRQALGDLRKNWKKGLRKGWRPVIVTRDNGEEVYVHLELNFFLRLLALARGNLTDAGFEKALQATAPEPAMAGTSAAPVPRSGPPAELPQRITLPRRPLPGA